MRGAALLNARRCPELRRHLNALPQNPPVRPKSLTRRRACQGFLWLSDTLITYKGAPRLPATAALTGFSRHQNEYAQVSAGVSGTYRIADS